MNQNQAFEKLKTFLDTYINQSTNGRVSVFPVRCGLGKSTYVKHMISNAIRSKDHGLIVVTDSLTRMESYTDDEYLKRNMDQIAILKNQTLAQEIQRQWYKPILIMSTQRYFSLTKEEIISFTKYAAGRRTKIIIDEKASIFTRHHIGILALNNVDSAFNEAIDDLADNTEKEWVKQQWASLIQKVKITIKTYEEIGSSQIEVWHQFQPKTVTDDDERFFAFVKKYHTKLNQYKSDTCSIIYAVKQLFNDGATFIGTKIASGEYKNYFIVTTDNSDLLLDLGADIYILDGTADIDPDYRAYFFDMINCSQFNVPLNGLTINFVDIPTSRNNILKSGRHANAIISSIQNYIKTSPKPFDAVFTYAAIEDQFRLSTEINGKEIKTGHFGNLKGFNDFRDCTNIAQIGWNRYPDSAYRQMDYITRLAEYDYMHKKVIRLSGKDSYISTMNKALLADFEQNLFRSKIRNVGCEDSVVYTVFCNTKSYAELIKMIRERYGSLGATINEIQTPAEFKLQKSLNRNTSHKTNRQVFLEWYNRQPNNRYFKTSEMLKECGLSLEQFRTVKKSDIVKEILSTMKTCVRGEYVIRK